MRHPDMAATLAALPADITITLSAATLAAPQDLHNLQALAQTGTRDTGYIILAAKEEIGRYHLTPSISDPLDCVSAQLKLSPEHE